MRDDLLGQFLVDAFAERHFLLHHLAGRVRLLGFHALAIDLALDQAAAHDVEHLLEHELGLGGQRQRLALAFDGAFALEIEAAIQFLEGIVHGIGKFMFVQLGHDIKRGHENPPKAGATGFTERSAASLTVEKRQSLYAPGVLLRPFCLRALPCPIPS
ncbi:hypothetical protein D3C77_616100 [compost metagenome]